MKLIHLYDVVSPTILVSLITGTSKFYLSKKNGVYKLTSTKVTQNFPNAVMFLYTLIVLDAITKPSNLGIFNYYQTTIANFGVIFDVFGGTIFLYTSYFNAQRNGENIEIFLNKLLRIDQTLRQFGGDLKYRQTYLYQVVNFTVGISSLLFLSIFQYANSTSAGLLELSVSLRVILFYPLLLMFLTEIQFLCFVVLIKYRFENINKELMFMNFKSQFILHVAKLSQKLETLIYLHDNLCDIVNEVNAHYGLQILLLIGVKFSLVVFSLFNCYWSKVIKGRLWSSIFWFLWACYNLVDLLHISIVCQTVSSEAQQTEFRINKLLLNVSNTSLKEKLTTFSLQLLHRRVRFTALQLFAIDATLFASVIASASTYLIIMLQFQESNEYKNVFDTQNITS